MNAISIIIGFLALVVGGVAGYFYHRNQSERALKNQQDKADNILKVTNTQARLIETQAREKRDQDRPGRGERDQRTADRTGQGSRSNSINAAPNSTAAPTNWNSAIKTLTNVKA